jgi:hypothetical protein
MLFGLRVSKVSALKAIKELIAAVLATIFGKVPRKQILDFFSIFLYCSIKFKTIVLFFKYIKLFFSCQWFIAQLVERSLSDPGSNLGTDICSFRC